MSIETTLAQAAKQAAEADWSAHRKGCPSCGSKRRGVPRCARGAEIELEARARRDTYRESKAADSSPGPDDVALFDLDELVPAWAAELVCGHINVNKGKATKGKWYTCSVCQGQKRCKRVFPASEVVK